MAMNQLSPADTQQERTKEERAVGVVQYEGISVMSLLSGITLKEIESRAQNLSLEETRNTFSQSNISVLEGRSTTLQTKTG